MVAVLQSKKPASTSERKKVYVLVALLGVLALSVAYSYFGESSTPSPAPADERTPTSSSGTGQGAGAPATERVGYDEPLRLEELTVPPVPAEVARNPFAYPPLPPRPIPKPPPAPRPPTILIGNVTPSSVVAGVPRGVDVTVTGKDFPVDARVLWNGRTMKTQRVGPDQLRVSLTAADIANAGPVRVKVVSESQPTQLWSEERGFDVREAPRPNFQYIGRVGDVALVDYGGQGNQKSVHVGDVIGQPAIWKVLAIDPTKLDLLDTKNEIRRSVAIKPRQDGR